MSAAKSFRHAPNNPVSLPTRLITPRDSTVSHGVAASDTGSASSRQSNTSIKRKKHRRSKDSSLSTSTTSSEHSTSPRATSATSAFTFASGSTVVRSPTMDKAINKRQDKNNSWGGLGTGKSADGKHPILTLDDNDSDYGGHSEPKLSLFTAARELQRRNVSVRGLSIHHLPTTTTQAGRDNTRGPNLARTDLQPFPEHLLAMSSEPSSMDVALRTVLNAGATVDFNASPYGSSTQYNGATPCIECGDRFTSESDYEEHMSWDDRYCAYCKTRFDCRGKLVEHRCQERPRLAGRKMTNER